MGKKKKNTGKKSGNRFFRWIKSDLPDEEDKKSPVLLLGVQKITDSPSFVRRRSVDPYTTGSIRFYRPPKPKYTHNLQGDERLERIRQDLLTHKQISERYIPRQQHFTIEATGNGKQCLNLNCARYCVCDRQRSSERGSFSLKPVRQSSLCPSEPYHKTETKQDYSENEIEFKYTELIPDIQPCSSKQHSYNVTPKSTDRRHFLLANLNERFRKTLSLDSRKVDTNRTPLSLPQTTRPKSLVNTSNVYVHKPNDVEKGVQAKKKRKSFFSLEGIFDSKKSDTSSVDDYCSSKYKRFELESDDSPLFRRETRNQEKTPDLLNLPIIIDSVKKKQSDAKRQLEKLETHYYRSLKTRPIVDCIPKDATEPKPSGSGQSRNTNHVYIEDDDVEYIEPIRSTFTSQSTLILDKSHSAKPKSTSILTINTDDTDIKLPSSVSPKSVEVVPQNDIDSIGAFEIEVREEDLLKNTKNLTVKVMMDKSVDSIGSCSLDVDASTDFSDTTSGSLNLLTPSSTGSRIRDFTSRIHERTQGTPTVTPNRISEDATPTPRPDSQRTLDNNLRPQQRADTSSNHLKPSQKAFDSSDNHLRPPTKISDSTSHRSRNKKRDEHKKPSYLHLACSVNGYTNLTTYDSKLRQELNKSREASPIRPVTYQNRERNSLIVPVPVGANKLLLSTFGPHETQGDLTTKAPLKALTVNDLAPINAYMADENKQLKKDFLGPSMATTTRPYISTESKNFAASMLHQKDEIDNAKELTFKSSYSETNFSRTVTTNGKESIKYQQTNSESYTISSNGVSKHIEITKENGEKLTSPMKSFIQQRVERLYGPGALAQGFLMQKRQRKSFSEDDKVLTEKSLNHQIHYITPKKCEDEPVNSNLNAEEDPNVSLPVLRHLRPEFRAQLPILSPKKSPKETVLSIKNIPSKTETEPCEKSITNGVSVINLDDSNDSVSVDKSICELNVNGTSTTNGMCEKLCKSEVVPSASDGEVAKDVYYFLELKRRETERLIELAVSAEKELEELQKQNMSEEVLGLLRAASGKARLLATQKMQQFEGLCHNHINQAADEPFPTTVEDLQGFWDMVCLQVTSVDQLYRQLDQRRTNQWREESPPLAPRPMAGRPRPRAAPAPAPPRDSARLAAQRRDDDRRAMLEHRRRVARERMLASRAAAPGTSREQPAGLEGSQEVEIFVGKAAKPSKVAPRGDCMSTAHSEDSIQS